MHIFSFLILVIYFLPLTFSTLPYFNRINGKLNDIIQFNVSITNITVLFYKYSDPTINDHEYPLKINIEAKNFHRESILVIIKDSNIVVSSIELKRGFNNSGVIANRTICQRMHSTNSVLSVEVSTQALNNCEVSIQLVTVTDFLLKINEIRTISINKNNPAYYLFRFENDIDKIAIEVNSSDSICMILSIQSVSCPINDNIMNVKYSGEFQTVLKSGGMIIQNGSRIHNRFYIVFVLNNNDEVCQGKSLINYIDPLAKRQKTFQLKLKTVTKDYFFPIFGAIGFYLLFYVIAPLISYIYRTFFLKKYFEDQIEVVNTTRLLVDPVYYGTICGTSNLDTSNYNSTIHPVVDSDYNDSSSVPYHRERDPNDESNDSESIASVEHCKKIYVSDLSKKKSTSVNRKYFLYLWYLAIISVFYGLPVVQLVINFQQTFDSSGNQDICYFNFRCTRPLYIFTAFNNIISNIGYVLLGILFTCITWRRHLLYNECKLRSNPQRSNHGIPQYYGLFYSMGVSLTMEGIMSACYHICPSHNNFQFDTAYMYILACLCLTKIYQTRHPDINPNAHSFFMTMALFIFVGVVGVIYNKMVFWGIFTMLYFMLSLFLTCEIYYFGNYTLDIGIPIRLYVAIKKEKIKFFIPIHLARFIIIIFANIINLAFALYGAIMQPTNFASHFLAIFMTNLLLYFFIYIIMKVVYCEPFYHLSIVYVLVAGLCWGFSIYCFIKYPTDWQLTPALSREHNKECIFLDFYDIHDIWHFLSSLSMFFSFMALQNIDDSLFNVERIKIPVF